MKIRSYPEYREYFAALGFLLPGIALQEDGRSMVWYDADVKGMYQRGVVRYPVLEVERPNITAEAGPGNHTFTFRAAFSVLKSCAQGDFPAQEAAMDECGQICKYAIDRITFDKISEPDTFTLTPIRGYEGDNLFGWGVEFSIEGNTSFCWTPNQNYYLLRLGIASVGSGFLELDLLGDTYSQPVAADSDPMEVLAALAAQINAAPGLLEAVAEKQARPVLAIRQPTSPIIYDLNSGSSAWAWTIISKSW